MNGTTDGLQRFTLQWIIRRLVRSGLWLAGIIVSFVAGTQATRFIDPAHPNVEPIRQQILGTGVWRVGIVFAQTAFVILGVVLTFWWAVEVILIRWWRSRLAALFVDLVRTGLSILWRVLVPAAIVVIMLLARSRQLFRITDLWTVPLVASALWIGGVGDSIIETLSRPAKRLRKLLSSVSVRSRIEQRTERGNKKADAFEQTLLNVDATSAYSQTTLADIARSLDDLRNEMTALRIGR